MNIVYTRKLLAESGFPHQIYLDKSELSTVHGHFVTHTRRLHGGIRPDSAGGHLSIQRKKPTPK